MVTSRASIRQQVTKGGRKKKKPPLGSGKRFKDTVSNLKKRGARNPKALAAYIGRKKYGAKKFAAMAAKGRRRKA